MGLSGVVFGVIVVENAQAGGAYRSIWGFFTVPAKAYPWVLLLLWQLLMWGSVSFLGHLCGVLVRHVTPACMPSVPTFRVCCCSCGAGALLLGRLCAMLVCCVA